MNASLRDLLLAHIALSSKVDLEKLHAQLLKKHGSYKLQAVLDSLSGFQYLPSGTMPEAVDQEDVKP